MKHHMPTKAPTAADAAVKCDLFTADAAIANCGYKYLMMRILLAYDPWPES